MSTTPATPRRQENPQDSLRRAVRRKRRALSLTQAAVAQRLAVSRLIYHRMESGARIIHFNELDTLCKALRCNIEELIDDSQLLAAYRTAAKVLAQPARRP